MQLSLYELSKIGFGCHHASADQPGHAEALAYALEKGCNTIDTSSNYQSGKAEMLVGQVLKRVDRNKVFVMTKGGNVSDINLPYLQGINTIAKEDIIKTADNAFHCIDPAYLDVQMGVSRERMQLDCIDGYFLHNPEYYLLNGSEPSQDGYYARLKRAFEYLEEQVAKGKIRYYGISESSGLTDIARLADVAAAVSSSHHFKLMQFPFNLVENAGNDADSVLGIAKAHGLTTFGNRPLTIRENGKTYKLVKYTRRVSEAAVLEAMDRAFGEIEQQMNRKQLQTALTDVFIIKYLYLQWRNLDNDTFFSDLYDMYFMSFARDLFDQVIPPDAATAFAEFKTCLKHYIQRKVYLASKAFMAERGFPNLFDSKALTRNVCKRYLKDGIGHILLGMRHKAYVDDIATLLKS